MIVHFNHFSTFLSFQIALSASSILISTRNEENRDKLVNHEVKCPKSCDSHTSFSMAMSPIVTIIPQYQQEYM